MINSLENQPQPASVAGRVVAFFIDSLVLFFLHCSSFIFIGVVLARTMTFDIQKIVLAILLYLFFFLLMPPLLSMIYFTILHAYGGQTIGKMIMGLRVVSEEGGSISPGEAFLRWAGSLFSSLPFAMGFFWAFFDRKKCAWHDKLAGTQVIAIRNIS